MLNFTYSCEPGDNVMFWWLSGSDDDFGGSDDYHGGNEDFRQWL